MSEVCWVLVPSSVVLPALPAGAVHHPYEDAGDLIARLDALGPGGCVLLVEGVPADLAVDVAAAIRRRHPDPCIEVRLERWDGETPSPLSSACRGVISGFGTNGVLAAVDLLLGRVAPEG